MSVKGDFKTIKKEARDQGWRVVEKKETWLFYPPLPPDADARDSRYSPCRIGHTPSVNAHG